MEQIFRGDARKKMIIMTLENTISFYEELLPEESIYRCKEEIKLVEELYPDNDPRKAYLNLLVNECIRLGTKPRGV